MTDSLSLTSQNSIIALLPNNNTEISIEEDMIKKKINFQKSTYPYVTNQFKISTIH